MTSGRIPSRAATLLANLVTSGLDVPILDTNEARWDRLSSSPTGLDLRDRFPGALIGGAIDDAMGRPIEGRPTEVARARKVRAYQPWHGWVGGPKGTITDDTQMTMWLAESILASAEQAAGAEGRRIRGQRVRGQRSEERQSHRASEVRGCGGAGGGRPAGSGPRPGGSCPVDSERMIPHRIQSGAERSRGAENGTPGRGGSRK